jgi:tetratricopeptide (TPR) repeat protein
MLSQDLLLKTKTHQRSFDKQSYEDEIERLSLQSVEAFRDTVRQYAIFHIFFFSLGLLELFAIILFFSFLTQSALFAFTIAGLFFTGFAYFVLLFYFQAKKTQQLLDLKNSFSAQYRSILPFRPKEFDHHTGSIDALYLLFTQFHRQEYTFYPVSPSLETLSLLAKKFSVWTHWKDVHQFKEILLQSIIREYVHLVQLKATDLEVHAGLASTYIAMTKLYMDPRKSDPDAIHLWISPEYHSEEMHAKFNTSAHRALEELRILDAYAPNDPWVHMQLAAVYRDLGLIDKEIKEYETILQLAPKDQEILFRLGVLYFTQGQNAAALHLYEKLKAIQESKAEELLSFYGAAFIEESN